MQQSETIGKLTTALAVAQGERKGCECNHFTQGDVVFLTKLEMWETMDFEEWRANVASLRERIAALLPAG